LDTGGRAGFLGFLGFSGFSGFSGFGVRDPLLRAQCDERIDAGGAADDPAKAAGFSGVTP